MDEDKPFLVRIFYGERSEKFPPRSKHQLRVSSARAARQDPARARLDEGGGRLRRKSDLAGESRYLRVRKGLQSPKTRMRIWLWPLPPLVPLVAALPLLALGGNPPPEVGQISAAATAATRLSHKRTLPYPLPEVWPAAVRYLRVDRGYSIVDRDAELGYVLFEFPLHGEAKGHGSVEMVETTDSAGRRSVAIVVGTDAGPTHLPHAIGEGLAKKVRDERGPPAPPPPRPSAPPDPAPTDPDDAWSIESDGIGK